MVDVFARLRARVGGGAADRAGLAGAAHADAAFTSPHPLQAELDLRAAEARDRAQAELDARLGYALWHALGREPLCAQPHAGSEVSEVSAGSAGSAGSPTAANVMVPPKAERAFLTSPAHSAALHLTHPSAAGWPVAMVFTESGAVFVREEFANRVGLPDFAPEELAVRALPGGLDMGQLPERCRATDVASLLWHFGQELPQALDELPAAFERQPLRLLRLPSISSCLLRARHLLLLQALADAPQDLGTLSRSLKVSLNVLRADLASLFFTGALVVTGADA
jgi:hypothetical protein